MNLNRLVRDLDLAPVLMDIGASGQPPPIWRDIATNSTYVGFDPDLREIHEDRSSIFQRSVIINEAVTADATSRTIPFYLTHSPFCSTMLPPFPEATAHWLEQDNFRVESQTTVKATTIDAVVDRLKLPRIDWIKLDSQGVDLRLFNSISPSTRDHIMVVDTEPGLNDIYHGEDLFVFVHQDLLRQGFWLSGFEAGGFHRMRRGTLAALKLTEPYIKTVVRKTPAWFEARYLRSLEWLARQQATPRDYLMLWVGALVDNQLGFACDIMVDVKERFGQSAAFDTIRLATEQAMAQAHRRFRIKAAMASGWNPIRQTARKVVSRLIRLDR